MKASLALCIAAVALASFAQADVVEEETWYNAEGKVVKTVKRTLSGEDARKSSDWEPAWVIRERERASGVRRVTYRSPRRSWRGSSYGYGSGYFYPYAGSYYSSRSYYTRSGFTGHIRAGKGKTRIGIGYRTPGLSLRFSR